MPTYNGTSGADTITGSSSDDTIDGLDGSDSLYGGKGSDFINGGLGDDLIDGQDGSYDWAQYSDATGSVAVNLTTGTATGAAGSDTLVNIERVTGSAFGDTLTGNASDNTFEGLAGNDTMDGGAGWDEVAYGNSIAGVTVNLATASATGGAGSDVLSNFEAVSGSQFNDSITAGSSSSVLIGHGGNDSLYGGKGRDTLFGGAGDDYLSGADGDDTVNFDSATSGVIVDLVNGSASGGGGNDVLLGIESVVASEYGDVLSGNTANNSLSGGGGNDTLNGASGADVLQGGQGDDSLDGGADTDLVGYYDASAGVTVNLSSGVASGGAGSDVLANIEGILGSNYADALTGDAGANWLNAFWGNDTLVGADGSDTLMGGGGDDSLDGGAGLDEARFLDTASSVTVNLASGSATGGTGNDVLVNIENVYGSLYADTLTGDDTANVLNGSDGNDTLSGGAGADTLIGGAGNDSLDGGAITDRVNYTDLNVVVYSSATASVNVNLQSGTASDGLGGTDTLSNLNFVVGSAQNDTLTGSSTANLFEQFEGGAGNDTIDGGAIDPVNQQNSNRVNYSSATGSVTVNLTAGLASGSAGNDTLININHVRGSNSADNFLGSNSTLTEQFEGRAGNDTIDGAGGTDMVRYDSATEGVNVSLVTNTASDGLGGTDTLSNIEGIRGSNLNDTLTGGNTANGTGTTDGFEFFMGQGGNDTIDGGAGYDRVDYTSSTTGASVTLGGSSNGTASDGLGGTDTLINIEAVRGTEFNDTLTGSDTGTFESFEGRGGNDTIDGKGGTDRVDYQSATAAVSVNIATGTASDGYGGTDSFSNIENARGSAFNDTLSGDANANRLEGSAGNDTLTGGASSDAFVFALGSMDTVTDFVAGAGGDVIDVQSAVAGFTNFGGGNPFATGHLKLVQAGADTQLQADSDGTGTGVFQTIAVLTNVTAANLTTANFAGGYDPTATPAGVNLVGTAGADSLTGGAGNDTVSGLEGNDTLSGTSGNDSISGGDGIDSLVGGDGNDTLLGGADADTLLGGGGSDSLDGGAILDRINLADLNFTSYLGATSGVNINLATGVVQDGQGGTDTLVNINFVLASNFDDTVTGSTTSDLFEQFEGGTGNDTIDGGVVDPVLQRNGNRATYHSASAAVTVNLATGTATGGAGTDTLININHVRGSGYNDVLTGSNSNLTEQFEGRAGNDTIDGAGGTDMVRYDSATEAVNVSLATNTASDGLGGTDTLSNIEGIRGSSFADTLTGGNPANGSGATDGFEFFMGQGGNDTIDGGAGFDRTDYSTSTAGANVTLGGTGNGTASDGLGGIDTLISVEGVRGSSLNDTLTGSDTGTFETFEGREGNDTIDGKGGTDRVDYSFATTGAVVNLATGTASDGYGFTDTLSNIENIRGSAFDDVLTGNTGNNDILGQGGNDTLNGGDGHDTLDGSAGADSLSGGNGNDYLRAADGANDTLDGGADTDVAAYSFGGTSAVTFTATGASGTQADGLGGTDTLVSIEEMHIFTGSGADTITGDSLRNYIQGNGGNDTLTGGAGNDTFAYDFGQTNGTDRITDLQLGDSLSFNHFGGALVVLDSTIQTGDNPATLTRGQIMVGVPSGGVTKVYIGTDNTAGGDLTIELQGNYLASDFSVFNSGFGGNLNYNPGQNLTGTSGNDTINGAGSGDTIDGAAGNDNLNGQGGNDSVLGGDGDDYITAGGSGDGGSDTIDGGAGNDVASYNFGNSTAAVTFTASGTGTQVDPLGGTDTLISIEEMHIFGGSGADTLTGNAVRNYMSGNGGNDTLTGGAGNDTFAYDFGQGSGTDRITDLQSGDSFNFNHFGGALVVLDSTIQTGDNPATLARGQIMVGVPSGGVTKIYVGTDATAGGDLTIELQGNYLAGDFSVANHSFGGNLNYSPAQNLTGTSGNDTINGSGNADTIDGAAGNDNLNGQGGNDSVLGGDGDDYITAGGSGDGGSDTIDGGAGRDVASYSYGGATAGVTFTASDTGTQVDPLGGTDTLISIEEMHIFGGSGADTFTGNGVRNYMSGNGGNDTLTGGAGNDTFAYDFGQASGTDRITDLQSGDSFSFNHFGGALVVLDSTIQTGDNPAALTRGQIMVGAPAGGVTKIYVGTDGTAGGDLTIELQGSYLASDFSVSNFSFGGYLYYNLPSNVVGTSGNDNMSGSTANDTLSGLDGNDSLSGNGGNDSLIGGNGDDWMTGGAGFDTLDGGAGYDHANYSDAPTGVVVNMALGTASNDGYGSSDALMGMERVVGSNYADSITGNSSDNDFSGNLGNDTIDGAAGFDFVWYGNATAAVQIDLQAGTATGGEGNDQLIAIEGVGGSRFADNLQGSSGDNYFRGDGAFSDPLGANDTINGQGGFDVVDYRDDPAAVTANLQTKLAQDGRGGQDSITSIEEVRGSNFNDSITGSTELYFERFEGRGGNDTIDGGAITDTVNQANGNQVSYRFATAGVTVDLLAGSATGGAGTDVLLNINEVRGSAFNDTLSGSDRTDVTELFEGREGDDVIDGRGGFDMVRFDNATGGVTASLVGGTATGGGIGNDTFTNVEGLWGSSHADVLTGGNAANGVVANDLVLSEFFMGGGGSDTIDGGQGYDVASYQTSTTGVSVTLNDTLDGVGNDGFGGTDVLRNIEGVRGSVYNDVLTGSNTAAFESFEGREGNDTINGLGGTDRADYGRSKGGVDVNLVSGIGLDGYGGTDALSGIENVRGSTFNDVITGDANVNWLEGRAGDDTLTGGAGNDVFAYSATSSGTDTITDFGVGDIVGIAATLTAGTATAGDGSAVTGKNVQVSSSGGVTTLWIDTNNTAGAEVQVSLVGTFAAGSFTVTDNLDGTSSITRSGGQNLTGTAGNDSLAGGNDNDTLTGLDGADSLNGSSGNDSLDGGNQNDQLRGDSGNDTILGGDGNDYITGGSGDDSINGGAGTGDTADYFFSDTTAAITVNLGTGAVTGGAGNDTLSGIENVNASDFADSITGDANANSLEGRAGNDTLLGLGGQDNLTGGAGNDSLDGGAITDRSNYTDLNTVIYSGATTGVNVNLQTGTASDGEGGTDTLTNLNFVLGSSHNDTLTGSNTVNMFEQFDGGVGDDIIDGGAIDPINQQNSNRANYSNSAAGVTVNLAAGTATGGSGNDTLININHVRGSFHADTLIGSNSSLTEQFEGRGGSDTIDGAGGIDMVRYDSASVGVNVSLVTNTASDGLGGTDTLSNIEGIRGSSFNDTLTGGNTANGTGATDGFEFFLGQGGNDSIDGGGGYDRVDYSTATTGASVTLGGTSNGTASDGQGGTDTLINIEAVRGSDFNDTLIGSDTGTFESFEGRAGNDTIDGKGGTDRIDYQSATAGVNVNIATGSANDGYGGTDSFTNIENVRGGSFNDTLTGNANVNWLEGGAGNDTLTGGAGNDVFTFAPSGMGVDTITDFAAGDIVGIGAALTAGSATAGDGSAVTGKNVQVSSSGGVTTLWIDTNNAAGAELQIQLTGTFAAGQFAVTDNGNGTSSITRTSGLSIVGTAGADLLSGGVGDDTLDGQAGNDTLDGAGGADRMVGRAGNDTYVVDDAGDTVVEFAGEGADTILSSINLFTGNPLAGNVENLTLTGSSDLQGTGNALANVITGNGGHNLLRGDAGHDSLAGGDGNDTLDGGTGNDTLEGGTGADRMVGRVGDDLYFVDNTLDVIVEFGGEGIDTVRSSVTYALADTLEHLTLTGSADIDATGNYLGNVLIGNSGANYLRGGSGGVDTMTGGEGNDTLDGGTGADNATGGLGNDTYVVDNTGDIVTELADEGVDTVLSSVTHVLAINVENLTLTGTIASAGYGNGLNNSIIGNAIANQLNGNAGDDSIFGGAGLDTLDGGLGNDTLDGGTGGDRMVGRAGNDTYIVDNAGDVIVEFAGEGIDTVIASATAALAANVENLTLTGTAHLSAYGNVLANTLTGNAGDNFLRGDLGHDSLAGGAGNDTIDGGTGDDTLAGGTGSDRMVGRTGNDQYWIDDAGDVIVEFLGEGLDVVNSSISYTLADTLETLVLQGASHINAVGNVYANTLVGNDGNNSLSGGMGLDTLSGGAGDDTLDGGTGGDRATGGAGNDTYIVDNAADVVIEVAAEGTDTILSGVTFLAAAFIENLTLTGSSATSAFGNELANQIVGNGSANLLRGADGDDTLTGNGGADTLDGGNGSDVLNGGEGADRLVGRDGADVFAFLAASGTDTIVDFSSAQGDKIRLSVAINASGIVDAASALAAASASGADTLIALGSGNTVTLVGVNVASLTTMDFEVS